MADMEHGGSWERWVDEAAGPVVRPYAMTRGRTRPRGRPLDVVTIVVDSGLAVPDRLRLSREQHRLLVLCRRAHTVAELASELDLPLGVIGVLLGDLIDHGLLETTEPIAAGSGRPDHGMLRRVLDDLRAL